MTRSDPTGAAFRAAMPSIRSKAPEAANAVAIHVRHLERLLARREAERSALEARITEATEIKAERSDGTQNTHFMVVRDDSTPTVMMSTEDIVKAGIALADELLDETRDIGQLVAASAVRNGPADAAILGIALRVVTEQARPFIAAFRAMSGGGQ